MWRHPRRDRHLRPDRLTEAWATPATRQPAPKRNVVPTRLRRPATGSAKCVPMISVSESANRSMSCDLEA